MKLLDPTPAEAAAGLRALKQVLMSDGSLSTVDEGLLAAAQRHILNTQLDLAELAPISPAQLSAALPRAEVRERLTSAMVVCSFASGDAGPEQLAQVEAYAAALGTQVQQLHDLRLLVGRRLAMLRYDILRSMYIGQGIAEIWEDEGFKGILKTLGAFAGKFEDPALAARFQALGELPEGTLGRGFVEHCRSGGFAMPGEPHGAPEMIARHDMVRVLGGYGVDPAGELQVAAFTAGFRKEQGMSILLFVLCQFDLGVPMVPVAPAEFGNLDPERFFAALARGAGCTQDFFDDWDFWQHVHEPVLTLRERYGIAPA